MVIHSVTSIHCRSSIQLVSCPYVCLVRQVIVHEVPGQELEVEVYDKDPDKDDFLGRYLCTVHVSRTPESPFISSFMSIGLEYMFLTT